MNSFNFYNPTRIFFGQNAIENLSQQLRQYGKKVLVTYGGGSIKKNGIYDTVIAILKEEGKTIFELSGIMPNPRTEKVYEGIRICKKESIDFILAIGGGSVIDCTKFIAAGAKTDRDFWEAFLINQEECYDALPFGTVLTLAGTASEMDSGGVITKWDEQRKTSYGHELLFPKFSILDPTYTYTLPKHQMINGAIDTMSHVFETYFSTPDDDNLSDDLAEAILRNIILNLPRAIEDPTDYEARSNLMWCSTMALNGVIQCGKEEDWMSHQIEHALSAFYDIPHGAGLAVVHPNYMKYVYRNKPEKFARYAKRVWNIDPQETVEATALAGIEATRQFFREVGAPTTLQEVGIPASAIEEIANKTYPYDTSYAKMTVEDVIEVLKLCLEK